MKLFLSILSLFIFTLSAQYQSVAAKGSPQLLIEPHEKGFKFTSPMNENKKQVTSYAWRILNSEDGQGNALSFEYKGDGSPFLASVLLGANKYLLDAYEATFPLDSKEWRTITFSLSDFALNTKPWGVKTMGADRLFCERENLTHIGFGRGFQFHRFNHPSYSFTIRNIKFVNVEPNSEPVIKKGIKQFAKKLKSGKEAKVLLLGDSITEMGKEQSHFVHALAKLDKNAEVANAAIGGHSCRGGQIVLQRSLQKMPKPDLVYIMYGANDCKAITPTSGFNDKVFEAQLDSLIKRVTEKTGGTEFILVNGVPRIDPKTGESKNFVEPLMPAYERLSKKYGLVLCDTMSVYQNLSREEQEKYYKDSVHQSQEGLKFMGALIAKTIKENM